MTANRPTTEESTPTTRGLRIIDIRIEVEDDLYEQAWTVATRAADGIGEDLYEPVDDDNDLGGQRFTIGIFDASEELEP